MEKIGITKEIDRLGRIVIPKEMRARYGFTKEIELIATKDGILLKSKEYELKPIEKRKSV